MTKLSSLLVDQEAAREKGILEQSQITLVSTTDTTLEDIDRTMNDEEDTCGDEHPGCLKEEQDDQEAEVTVECPSSRINVGSRVMQVAAYKGYGL